MIQRSPYERSRSPAQALESGQTKVVRPTKKLAKRFGADRESDNSVSTEAGWAKAGDCYRLAGRANSDRANQAQ